MKQRAGHLKAKDRAYALHGQGTPVSTKKAPTKGSSLKSAPKGASKLGKVGKAAAVALAGKALYDASRPAKDANKKPSPKQKKGK